MCSSKEALRRAAPPDVRALEDLERRSFSGDRLSRRSWRRLIDSPSAIVTIASGSQQQPLAASVLLFRSTASVARLYSIAVDAAARGRGLGQRVLQRCVDDARAYGCDRLRLETRADNHAAQRLFRGLGFREFARKPSYYEDGQAAWRFEKSLLRAGSPCRIRT